MKYKILYTLKTAPRVIWDFWVNIVAASKGTPEIMRHFIYRTAGIKSLSMKILPNCFFTYFKGERIKIGKDTFVNYGCFFDNSAPIEIGENCDIAFQVMFCTSTHEIAGPNRRAGSGKGVPIKVGNGCWIGARCLILPGVNIGNGCIIAAGSIVTSDCKPNGLYAGVPAKRIKELIQ